MAQVVPGSSAEVYRPGDTCTLHAPAACAAVAAARSKVPFLGGADGTVCMMPPSGRGEAMGAPGPAAGIVVATHFVYSTALKRKRTFRALGWDAPPAANRTRFTPGACWSRARKGILFGHTYLTYSSSSKSVLCAELIGPSARAARRCRRSRASRSARRSRRRTPQVSIPAVATPPVRLPWPPWVSIIAMASPPARLPWPPWVSGPAVATPPVRLPWPPWVSIIALASPPVRLPWPPWVSGPAMGSPIGGIALWSCVTVEICHPQWIITDVIRMYDRCNLQGSRCTRETLRGSRGATIISSSGTESARRFVTCPVLGRTLAPLRRRLRFGLCAPVLSVAYHGISTASASSR